MIRLSIRRPVAVAMAYLAVALLGVAAWRNIPLERLPETELPRLTVGATWPGASPETIEAFLTSPIEGAVQQVRGVERISSVSSEQSGRGRAEVEVEFARGTDMNFARLDLSERMAAVEEELPEGTSAITVDRYVPREFEDQTGPFMSYTFTGPYTLEALRRHLDDVVAPALAELDGVADALARGGRARRVHVVADPDALTALDLGANELRQAIDDLDLVREAGVVREGEREWAVTVQNRARGAEDIRAAVLLTRGDRLIRVGDVARVSEGFEDAAEHYRIDGRPAVSLHLFREIGSNTVRVADRVKARMAELERQAPYGARFILDRDSSEEVRRQLTDLRTRALIAAGVIFLVLLLFLRSFRSAGVVFATIAFSVLIALNLIYFGGMSLNLLTLMGLAMGFGLIVDNSIVVLENVYRRWQAGAEAPDAAERGSVEVALPILASTATTLIVFVPFVYLQGELRVYYVPLAVVVALTLLASLFVAFTFIPALSARILGDGGRVRPAVVGGPPAPGGTVGPAAAAGGGGGDEAGAPAARGAGVRDGATERARRPLYIRFYSELVGFTLRHPWLAVLVAVLAFGGSYRLFDQYVTRGVLWGGMGGDETYVDVRISLPRGSDLERTDELARHFEEKLAALPEVERYVTNVRGTWGLIHVTFPDSLELTPVPVAIKEQMVAHSLGFTGADVRVYGVGPSFAYGGGGGAPNYSVTVLGYNYETVRAIAENLGRRLERLSRIEEVDTNASGSWFTRDRAQEYVARIDRSALDRYGLTVDELVQRMNAAVAGSFTTGRVKLGGEDVEYDVKLEGAEGMDVLALRETIVTVGDGTAIRLGDVLDLYPRRVLARVERENQQYRRRVAYEFRGPSRLGDLMRDRVVEATHLPAGYTLETSREWSWGEDEKRQIYLVLALSVLLVYMVTSALFESFRQPMCVLLTVPMALIGVFLIFFFLDASFTREAYIGVIMMGGIVVNNAILLVDHVNRVRGERREEEASADGLAREERRGAAGLEEGALTALRTDVLRGTLERVRPILMTTATTVLGLLPLVLFSETADANIWNALGYALIGGLLSSTLFVLTVTPALYLLFERGKARKEAWLGSVEGSASGAADPDRKPLGGAPEPGLAW